MEVKQIKALTEHVEGKMIAIASSDDVDRVGDSLKVADWDFKNFKKNPVLLAGHDYRPQYVIGVAKNIRSEGNRVIFEPVFHSITNLAKELKQMYEESILKAWSVGFIPGDRNELLEVSAVAVPANAEALMLEVKSLDGAMKKQVESQISDFVSETKDVEESDTKEPETDETEKTEETEEIKTEEIEKAPEDTTIEETVDEKTEVQETVEIKEEETEVKEETVEVEKVETLDNGSTEEVVAIEKEGRILSGKNRELIKNCVNLLKDSAAALDNLLEASAVQKTEEVSETPDPVVHEKVEIPRKTLKTPLSKEQLAVRILKEISKNSSYGLNQLKK